ncbi:MAG: ADP-ribosylation factor-like protein [Promethearchaeota archaeon]
MKISLVGLSGCGKTSLYSVTFAMKSAQETKKLAPTILYEVRRHPFLGLEVSLFDFGGQDQYQQEYVSKPQVFSETDVLIPVVDLHDPQSFEKAKEYFQKIINIYQQAYQKPRVYIFFHKYDTEDGYQKELLDSSVGQAKEVFLDLFKDYDPQWSLTSIYEQEKLSTIFRDILISSYETLRTHIEKAEDQLKEIKAKIIVADISGNVIVHNVAGITSGLQLRGDFRDFIEACNTMRENFFMSDSAKFSGSSDEDKELELHIFKYILAVLVLKSDDFDSGSMDKLRLLLQDMKLFADLVVSAHEE